MNTDSPIKEEMLNEYLYPYIPKDKINIHHFRTLGEPLTTFSYTDNEDNEIEEVMDNDIKSFIDSILIKIKEGYTINI